MKTFFLYNTNCGILIKVACENPELMFSTDKGTKSPYIITNNVKDQDLTQFLLNKETKFKVIVEGEVIGSPEDLFTAFTLYMTSFYVFNVAYPKDFENSLTFIQKFFLEILDNRLKAQPRVLTLISKVKNKL